MGFGDSLKKWATSKVEEAVTSRLQPSSPAADATAAPAATTAAPAPASPAQPDAGEALLRAAFPKLGAWADQQQAAATQRDADRTAQADAEIAALPVAQVSITLTGVVSWQWSGPLHVRRTEVGPKTLEPDDYGNRDPYSRQTILSLELLPAADARPPVDGHELCRWAIELPGWTGDATYDLIAIHRIRAAAGYDLDLDRNQLELGEDSDLWCYLDESAGPSTVTVSGSRFSVSMSMSSASGRIVAVADIALPA